MPPFRFLALLPFLTLFTCRSSLQTTHPDVAKWQKITLDFPGPATHEQAATNPFTDYRLDVTFTHGDHTITIPGFYAADGQAAHTGANSGSLWQARFRPDREGDWSYTATLSQAPHAYLGGAAGEKSTRKVIATYSGAFFAGAAAPGETGRLIRSHPRYLRWAESGDYLLKTGVGSPENLLAYAEFDSTYRHSNTFREGENRTEGLHLYAPHLADWRAGDPEWAGGRGHGLIGGINYLASVGVNSMYFLTMNIGGDGKDVWPYTSHEVLDRFDVSKLDQWEMVFDHADSLGMVLHFVLNETENETLLDGGDTGPQRQLYYRELVARFGHHRALIWDLGEENGPNNWSETAQTSEQQRAMLDWFARHDPYRNHRVLHTQPVETVTQAIYLPLLGNTALGGLALQLGHPYEANAVTQYWLSKSDSAAAPWTVSLDEQGPYWRGLDPDDRPDTNQDTMRALALWGHLMAGGAGVEWYYGARNPHNDLNLEDWRSRDRAYRWSTHARRFFQQHLPFAEMEAHNELLTEAEGFCLATPGERYAVFLPFGRPVTLDLSGAEGEFTVRWYDPRHGGDLVDTGERVMSSDGQVRLVPPGEGDWAGLLQKVAR